MNKYEEKVDFLSESIDGIAIFRVYTNSHLDIAFRRFFSNISHSVLGHTCYNYIKNHEFLSKFVKENKILEEIIKEDKKVYYYLKGRLYNKEGKYDEAFKSFEKSIIILKTMISSLQQNEQNKKK